MFGEKLIRILTYEDIKKLLSETLDVTPTTNNIGNFDSIGYTKLPNGFILQWGYVDWTNPSSNEGSYIYVTINFPITFPNKCLILVATNKLPDTGYESTEHTLATQIVSNSQGKIRVERVYGTNPSGHEQGHTFWLAIGY